MAVSLFLGVGIWLSENAGRPTPLLDEFAMWRFGGLKESDRPGAQRGRQSTGAVANRLYFNPKDQMDAVLLRQALAVLKPQSK